ncbi:family 15 glycoside hydrolase [Melampsora americana]|nr:family 15 glycoside hydrolase [Melampsora americana]
MSSTDRDIKFVKDRTILTQQAKELSIDQIAGKNLQYPTNNKIYIHLKSLLALTALGFLILWSQDLFGKLFEHQKSEDIKLDQWIETQTNISWNAMINNIGVNGSYPGVVIASPSTYEPDYFYTWTRDSALVMKEIVIRYEDGDNSVLNVIKSYISVSKVIQDQSRLYSTVGLGEPKYYVNGHVFMGPWGRPQRDGPALRATTLIKFAKVYLQRGGEEASKYVREVLYDGQWDSRSVIKADLEYIASTWSKTSFDLWEEVDGHHYYTFSVIRSALADGVKFSHQMNDPGAADWYQLQLSAITPRLDLFWDNQRGVILATQNWTYPYGKTSWLDVSTILASLHTENNGHPSRPSSQILATHHALVDSMSDLYPLNRLYASRSAKAIGRYPEDVYDGVGKSEGNPWYLATLACAEMLYRTVHDIYQLRKLNTPRSIYIGHEGLAFWRQFDHSDGLRADSKIGIKSSKMIRILSQMKLVADDYVRITSHWITNNGSMHEQFDRHRGTPKGARDLTWSYAAFLSMDRARKSVLALQARDSFSFSCFHL